MSSFNTTAWLGVQTDTCEIKGDVVSRVQHARTVRVTVRVLAGGVCTHVAQHARAHT